MENITPAYELTQADLDAVTGGCGGCCNQNSDSTPSGDGGW